jgi:hypothetical protein
MFASQALRDRAMALLATDATTLAPVANQIYIALCKAPFIPAENLNFAGITLADFDGSTPIGVTVGAQPEALVPGTFDSRIDLSPPVGGFRFVTTGITNLPQTIYGFVLLDHAKTTLLASELLAQPVLLTVSGEVVADVQPSFTLPANSISE